MNRDVCIIGGGAAGLTAGVFAARRGLSSVIFTKDLGGQTSSTAEIENYPGLGRIEGPELIARFADEARGFGCEIVLDEVASIEIDGDHFRVSGRQNNCECSAVILAFGKTPRDIGALREKDFYGKGVGMLSVPVPGELKEKTVAVIGGGNSALDAAVRLSDIAARVYLIHRNDTFSGEQILVERLSVRENIVKKTPYVVMEIQGTDRVSGILVEQMQSHIQETISVDAVFPAVGFEPRPGSIRELVACDEVGRIIVDPMGATNVPGIFAAGDNTTVPYQQIVISAGDGAKAALSAYHFIQKKFGKRSLKTDWGFVVK